MSDGLSESKKYNRKDTYLTYIELSKDQLFDQYMDLTQEIINITDGIIYHSKSDTTFWNVPCANYEQISSLETQLLIRTTKLSETKKLIEKLDQDYEEIENKPLNYFS